MFTNTAQLYDLIYESFKDYMGEARQIHELIRDRCKSARSILDVGCGTGEHARIIHDEYGYLVDGIDLDKNLVALAQKKNPEGRFACADMVDFDLGRTYDVVMCLFSSIGYVKTLDNVQKSLERFSKHLNPGGVILVEPWFTPETCSRTGAVYLNTVERGELKIARMGFTQVAGRLSTIRFEYLVGTPGEIRHQVEIHELGLFTTVEMTRCFEKNGLEVELIEGGLSGRGLYIARRKAQG